MICDRLVHWADNLNHWTRPAKGRCWSLTLCLHDSELTAWEDGAVKRRPTWGEALWLARIMKHWPSR